MPMSPNIDYREYEKFRDGATGLQSRVAVTLEGFNPSSTGHSAASNTTPSVTTSSTEILAANTNRKYACIFNNTGAAFYLKFGATAVVNQGIRLGPNEKFEIKLDNLWLGAVNAIRASGAAAIDVFEGT